MILFAQSDGVRCKVGQLPEKFHLYLNPKKIPSLRSIIDVMELPPVSARTLIPHGHG